MIPIRWLLLAFVVLACQGCGDDPPRRMTPADDIFHAEEVFPPPEDEKTAPRRRRKKRKRVQKPATTQTPTKAIERSTDASDTKTALSEADLAKQAARAALAAEESLTRSMAAVVGNDILDRRDNYDRKKLAALQARTGLTPDGIYGGASAGMLRFYLAPKPPPKPLFKPTAEVTYVPR